MGKESWLKAALVWLAIIVLFVLSFKFLYKPHEDIQKTYPQFQSYIEKPAGDPQSIVSINIRSDNLRGDEITAKLKDNTSVTTYGPADDGVRAQLRKDLELKKFL